MWYCIASEVHKKQTGPQAIKEHETPHGLARFAICVSRKGQQSKPFIQTDLSVHQDVGPHECGLVGRKSIKLADVGHHSFRRADAVLRQKVPWFLFPQLHVWVAAEENDSYLDLR